MSMEVSFTKGQSKEIPLFGADQHIQAVRFMFGSTMVELKPSHGAYGSASLDILLRQTHAPVPPAVAAAPTSGLAVIDVNAYPSSTQRSDVRDNSARPLLQGNVRNNAPEIELSTQPPDQPLAGDMQANLPPSSSEEVKHDKEMRGWIMLVATLFAGMMFQAGITPPGGFWQDDSDATNSYPVLADFINSTNMTSTAANTNFAIISLSPLSFVVLSSSSNLSNFNATMTPFGSSKNDSVHIAGNPVWDDKRENRYGWFKIISSLSFFYSLFVIFAIIQEKIFVPFTSQLVLKSLTVVNIILVSLSYTIGTRGDVISWLFPLFFFLYSFEYSRRVICCTNGRCVLQWRIMFQTK